MTLIDPPGRVECHPDASHRLASSAPPTHPSLSQYAESVRYASAAAFPRPPGRIVTARSTSTRRIV